MKLTIEVEAPDHFVVPGLAAQLAKEVARLASQQLSGAQVFVVTALDGEPEYEIAEAGDETEPEPRSGAYFHYPWG